VKPISADGTATGGRVGRCLAFKALSFLTKSFFYGIYFRKECTRYKGFLSFKLANPPLYYIKGW
ncbi:hypothetical protein, partial [Tenacibaculum maritimum]|uniref:hypothetical protein n=1 Tax=Tenacibaculum maritimum TaxID=107401 RepID=UPI0038776464